MWFYCFVLRTQLAIAKSVKENGGYPNFLGVSNLGGNLGNNKEK